MYLYIRICMFMCSYMQLYRNGLIFLEVTSSRQILKSHLQNFKILFAQPVSHDRRSKFAPGKHT